MGTRGCVRKGQRRVLSQHRHINSKSLTLSNFKWNRDFSTHLMFFTCLSDFMWVWPGLTDFTGFWVLIPISHVLHVLTRKIVWFYESKRIFNNHGCILPVLILHSCTFDFTGFWVLIPISHVLHVLTRKIVWFYESKHIFNNHGCILPVLILHSCTFSYKLLTFLITS
jgi:hypothetical protein